MTTEQGHTPHGAGVSLQRGTQVTWSAQKRRREEMGRKEAGGEDAGVRSEESVLGRLKDLNLGSEKWEIKAVGVF